MRSPVIHGETKVYNDISGWKWQELLSFFNAGEAPIKSWLANTRGELIDILGNKEFAAADKIQLLEVKMDKMDAPRALIAQAQAVSFPRSVTAFIRVGADRRAGIS